MRCIAILSGALALAACSQAETEDLIMDPAGSVCREAAATRTGVSFEETSARPVSTGFKRSITFAVDAGGRAFSCTVNSDGFVSEFSAV